ncbi:diguanylate cyclase/phosphodiesterase with PAS/PAC sensor(s) [Catenulispora acidiphila DSM 44928]|uniref:Diguanylate cyclase/phosphodiesterase with PAS/PAC sensor(S) n=1 Tax=Catenulispora acidiphila (strain DSM 44928 / JCM 14897 / NBRC 102108 / NRRL B-24433 / ID139908) TaxID=479433 RepID=C7QII4_CATAD|nr:EAL domain-containing protein [Catenulispora acidiphila]ACU75061.1 diguanylate cyclase/phosphodiesterase with PAS/PAC sensor(s) [Catenulispora acidiphila DSM 44928]
MRSPSLLSGWPGRERRLLGILAAVLVVILAVFFSSSDTLRTTAWFALSVWTTAAMVVGIRANRPPYPLAWYLLAISAGLLTASNHTDFAYARHTLPNFADWLGLLGYPLALVGLRLIMKHRLVGRDSSATLDALIVVFAGAYAAWVYLVVPYYQDGGEPWDYRVIAILDPLGDLLLLGMLLRLIISPGARNAALWLLGAGSLFQTGADVVESVLRLNSSNWFGSHVGNLLLELAWLMFAACWVAASLVPSAHSLTRPVAETARDALPTAWSRPPRISPLVLAALVTPAINAVELAQGSLDTGWAGPVIGLGVYLMILARVAVMVRSHRQALARESILLAASEGLGVAAGRGQVAAALADGAAGLFAGRSAAHAVLVAVDGTEGVRVAAAGAVDGGAGDVRAHAPAALSGPDSASWRKMLTRVCTSAIVHAAEDDVPYSPALFDTDGEPEVRPAEPGSGPKHHPHFHTANVVHTADLPLPLARRLGPPEHAGVVPLDGATGMLVVAAAEEDLAVLGGALEILGRQASAALERIALSQEITRRDSEAYFRALVQNTSDTILIVDTGLTVRYASPSSTGLFGGRPLRDRPLTEVVGKVYAAEVAVRAADPTPQPPVRRDWEISADGGEPHEVEATIADLRAEPTVGGFVLSLHDVTTARGLERTLQRHAYRDPLTDLPNRLAFIRGLEDAVELASPSVSVTVMLLDLDRFREINDFHGREAGDEVLRDIAERIRSRLGPGDVLARTGGDEFAVLAVRRSDEAPILPIGMPGEDKPFYVGPIAVTTSGAVATCTVGASGASLLADAEMTLHAARGAGPNTWRAYDPRLRADLARSAARRSGLDRALAEGSFELYYQPIVWLDDGDIGGFEALVRWPQPDGTIIPPDEFIPLAEATGQILPLGRWILRTATDQAARWNVTRLAQGVAPVKISVNVSAHQLRDPGFPDEVGKALTDAGLDPAFLMVEATESSLIDRAGTALANLRTLTRSGVGVSLDDFGTGYSSLSYLRDLPVNTLKIDKAFVDGVPDEPRQTALVKGIIGIAKSLTLMVVAEGVETSQQRRALARMGADLGQGYLYARPMRVDEATKLMCAGHVKLPRGMAGPEDDGEDDADYTDYLEDDS